MFWLMMAIGKKLFRPGKMVRWKETINETIFRTTKVRNRQGNGQKGRRLGGGPSEATRLEAACSHLCLEIWGARGDCQ
jgi:hypothetical protein